MNKIILIVLILLTMNAIPFTFGHPDPVQGKIMTNGEEVKTKWIGIKSISSENKEVELFSNQWFWKNFMLLLLSTITTVISLTIFFIFREDISFCINLNINKN